MKSISIGPIKVEYCEKCFEYEVKHNPNLIFHAMNPKYLERHPNFVLKPENRHEHEHEAPHYHRYLPKDFIHLAPLEIAHIGACDSDVNFCFELDTLKQSYHNVRFMDCSAWDILGFFDVEECEKKDLEERLFVSDYNIEQH